MADSYMVDVNNREQIKEFLVYVSTSPDGVKMGARAVAITGSTLPIAQRLPVYQVSSSGAEPSMATAPLSDGRGYSVNGTEVVATIYGDNGTTRDKWRNNTEGALLASAARTASVSTSDQINFNARSLMVTVDVTAVGAAPSITVAIQVKDPASGKYITVLASAAIIAIGTTRLRVVPGGTVSANLAADDILTRTWRVLVTNANTDSITYSVGHSLNV